MKRELNLFVRLTMKELGPMLEHEPVTDEGLSKILRRVINIREDLEKEDEGFVSLLEEDLVICLINKLVSNNDNKNNDDGKGFKVIVWISRNYIGSVFYRISRRDLTSSRIMKRFLASYNWWEMTEKSIDVTKEFEKFYADTFIYKDFFASVLIKKAMKNDTRRP